jgi:hypothetical protein
VTDKTEAMENLIAQDADLIEICPDDLMRRLRADVFYGDARLANMNKHNPLHMEAADRIEALTTENFKLAAGSCDVEGGKVGDEHGHFYCTLQAKVEAQAAEIERLREALEYYAQELMTGPWGIDSLDFGDVARAALEQSK